MKVCLIIFIFHWIEWKLQLIKFWSSSFGIQLWCIKLGFGMIGHEITLQLFFSKMVERVGLLAIILKECQFASRWLFYSAFLVTCKKEKIFIKVCRIYNHTEYSNSYSRQTHLLHQNKSHNNCIRSINWSHYVKKLTKKKWCVNDQNYIWSYNTEMSWTNTMQAKFFRSKSVVPSVYYLVSSTSPSDLKTRVTLLNYETLKLNDKLFLFGCSCSCDTKLLKLLFMKFPFVINPLVVSFQFMFLFLTSHSFITLDYIKTQL